MDQLHDSPAEDSTLFIYWHVWIYFVGISFARVFWALIYECSPSAFSLLALPVISFVLLPISLFLICCSRFRRWFVVEPGLQNPYKLVIKVIRFAATHNHPIQRSAFTYCEDELPSRLDLGKNKYGGPFTTEEVENVKVFIGMFFLLITLGPFCLVEIAACAMQPVFNAHLIYYNYDGDDVIINGTVFTNYQCGIGFGLRVLFGDGVITPILVVVLIPIFIFCIRPYTYKYIPGMLKRIGLGILFHLMSLVCTLSTDIVGHSMNLNNTTPCMFTTNFDTQDQSLVPTANSFVFLPQDILNSIGYILFYTSAYEFICSQSPHQMKGLIIGTFFAIKGLFQLFGVVLLLVPFTFVRDVENLSPSCGFAYYLINVLIGILGFVAYTWVARRYKYRQRDELSNIHQFVENYYEKIEDEPGYDYDDLDEHDIHTVRYSAN